MADRHQTDLERVIGEVAARHNILLKPDDAAFALVTINRLILEDVVEKLLKRVGQKIEEFEQTAEQVQIKAGGVIGKEVKEALGTIREELAKDSTLAGKQVPEMVQAVHGSTSKAVVEKWITIGLVCALALFLAGILVGRLMT
ncbi:MAG TPA: hypothetical protein VKY31_04380 [Terriglobia bacterium]|nr:hypothetical protein [Terriglobia bacterium]